MAIQVVPEHGSRQPVIRRMTLQNDMMLPRFQFPFNWPSILAASASLVAGPAGIGAAGQRTLNPAEISRRLAALPSSIRITPGVSPLGAARS